MKKLLITLMLVSPFSFADWGDVYYCQMTNNIGITLEGKKENYKLEKFQFELDKAQNAMVFGNDGYFKKIVMELREGFSHPLVEVWYADSQYARAYFNEGKFLYVATGHVSGNASLSANCDFFK